MVTRVRKPALRLSRDGRLKELIRWMVLSPSSAEDLAQLSGMSAPRVRYYLRRFREMGVLRAVPARFGLTVDPLQVLADRRRARRRLARRLVRPLQVTLSSVSAQVRA